MNCGPMDFSDGVGKALGLNKDISGYPFGSGSSITYVPREKGKW